VTRIVALECGADCFSCARTAQKDFAELVSAASTAQLVQLRTHTGVRELQADPGFQEATGKEGDVKTLCDEEVFMARIAEANNQVDTMQNEDAIPVPPQTHESASQKDVLAEESL
jgi:hypothetical protein